MAPIEMRRSPATAEVAEGWRWDNDDRDYDSYSITAQLNLMDEEVGALSKTVEELFEKMSPFLAPPAPTADHNDSVGRDPDAYSSLAWSLRTMSDVIHKTTDRVSEMKNRLAV